MLLCTVRQFNDTTFFTVSCFATDSVVSVGKRRSVDTCDRSSDNLTT